MLYDQTEIASREWAPTGRKANLQVNSNEKITPLARLKQALGAMRRPWRRFWRVISRYMPKQLYARSLIIVIAPMLLLQSVIAFVFMERHWQTVTQRLSQAVTRDISAIIDMIETYPDDDGYAQVIRIAQERLALKIDLLPAPGPKPFFSILDQTLGEEITRQINRPFWLDTVGNSNIVEIRIQLDNRVLRVFARRSQAYASNTHIFLLWMVGTSLVLIAIAVAFLRNQIRPILQLAEAADSFGKGRPTPSGFHPRGAEEVRRAGSAFLLMRERIERQIEQRTAMLTGVSHDLRTILTRFKLQLAVASSKEDIEAMNQDNAFRYADKVEITARNANGILTITVDDDGPGIPQDMRESVFKPFVRLDEARNQDESGTGLGLSIARDIARSHGGDVSLDDSPLGGLRAVIRVPA